MNFLQESTSNPVTQFICQVYGFCGHHSLQKDMGVYLLQIFDAVGASLFQSKPIIDLINILKKFVKVSPIVIAYLELKPLLLHNQLLVHVKRTIQLS